MLEMNCAKISDDDDEEEESNDDVSDDVASETSEARMRMRRQRSSGLCRPSRAFSLMMMINVLWMEKIRMIKSERMNEMEGERRDCQLYSDRIG
jgi:hypothetical protein